MSTREVILEGGSPWGFRMHGGIDVHQPLRISRVNPGSKASLKGVREGDLITSINGRATKEISNSEAHTLLKSSGDRLILGLNEDCQNSPKRRQYKTILHHHHKEVVEETSKTSTSTSHTTLITTNECPNQSQPQTEETFEQTDCNNSQLEPSKISRCNGQSKTNDNFQIIKENDTTTEILNDKNPFRQPLKNEGNLKDQEQSQIDETPSISTITPTASPPTLTPTSSHYSSDTRGVKVCCEQLDDNNLEIYGDAIVTENINMPQNKRNKKRKHLHKKASSSKGHHASKVLEPSIKEFPVKEKVILNKVQSTWQAVEIQELATTPISISNNSSDASLNYRVDSPVLNLEADKNAASRDQQKCIQPSRSFDSLVKDLPLKITEVKSGDELSDDESQIHSYNEAIISIANDDVDWEHVDLDENEPTSQEDAQLRYFIEKLNLPGVSGPRVDENIEERDTEKKAPNDIKQKRYERRQLIQYFTPMSLEAITEENNDQYESTINQNVSSDDLLNKESDIVNVLIVERDNAELVVLDSTSSEEETDQGYEINDNEEKIESETPLKKQSPQTSKNYIDNKEEAINANYENVSNNTEVEEIEKDIFVKETTEETTKHITQFELKVKKIFPKEEIISTTNIISKANNVNQDNLELEEQGKCERNEMLENHIEEQLSKDVNAEILAVQQKILKTEMNIAHDQEIIDQLQNSLEQDQKEIQEAQNEIQHLKCFEEEFQEVFNDDGHRNIKNTKERSTSRSSESSSSSNGTTVILKASAKDMAAIIAEAEGIYNNDGNYNPPTLKELCLLYLNHLPFGAAALEELAVVSNNLKKLINSNYNACCSREFNSREIMEIVTKTESNCENKQMLEDQNVIEEENGFSIITKTTQEVKNTKTEEIETVTEDTVKKTAVSINSGNKLLNIILEEKQDNVRKLRELEHRCNSLLPKRQTTPEKPPRRRRSLPPEIHIKQMQYLIEKEKQIQSQLEQLEVAKRRLMKQMLANSEGHHQRPKSLPPHEEHRQRMYEEYQKQLGERERRRTQHVIKISLTETDDVKPTIIKDFNDVQREFMEIVEEKRRKQKQNGIEEVQSRASSSEKSIKSESDEVLVLDGDKLCTKKIPKHLKDFLSGSSTNFNGEATDEEKPDRDDNMRPEDIHMKKEERRERRVIRSLARNRQEDKPMENVLNGKLDLLQEIIESLLLSQEFLLTSRGGIWSPGQKSSLDKEEIQQLTIQDSTRSDESVPVIWTPKSAGSSPLAERKELQFRPLNFESPVFSRKNYLNTNVSTDAESSWKPNLNNTSNSCKKFEGKDKLSTSQSAPGLGFSEDLTHRLPKAQNPTITLLQKARQGQIPSKSAIYIEQEHSRKKNESPYNSQNELIYNLRTESISDSESEKPKHINVPTTTHGMPLGLRSEIRDANMSQWYRKMYDTIHKHRPSKYDDEEYVTIRYKQRNRGKYPYVTGYLSEPEIGAYDSDAVFSDGNNYSTLDRRRTPLYSGNNHKLSSSNPARAYSSSTLLPGESRISNKQKQSETTTITYKPEVQQSLSAISLNRPGKIENYTPGKSSISDIEAKKWWDEVMDIFDGMEKQQLQQQRQKVPLVQPKGYLSQALKESGYESDSTLVFRRRDETAQQMNPQQQREVYKNIQKGGDVPLYGLRKSAPEPPKEEFQKKVNSTFNRLKVQESETRGKQTFCYPILAQDANTFAAYKRTAPSNLYKSRDSKIIEKIIVNKPPSPPRRKSSRNNKTLRMIHKNKSVVTTEGSKRHKTCFSPTPKISPNDTTNVKRLREKITTKLLDNTNKTNIKKGIMSFSAKICNCSRIKPCSKCAKGSNTKLSSRNPIEVKKAVVSQINSMNGKTSSAILAKLNGNKTSLQTYKNKTSKTLSTSNSQLSRRKVLTSTPSIESSRSTLKSTSMDSLKSIKSTKPKVSTVTKCQTEQKTPKKTKSKKELINTRVKNREEIAEKVAYVPKPIELSTNHYNGFFKQLFFGPENKSATANKPKAITDFESTNHPRRCDLTISALKRYLGHTKPVSESRFKYLDMVRSRSTSPGSQNTISRYDERSISLPPKLIFTPTSRPSTPTLEGKTLSVYKPDWNNRKESKIEKIILSQSSRPVSPRVTKSDIINSTPNTSRGPSPSPIETLYFTETSRPRSPVILQQAPPRPVRPASPKYHLPRSPKVNRSPSYRKIKQQRPRAHSVDVQTNRSIRFKELHKFYQDLERFGQLERTASSNDLRPRRLFERAIIDYDRWQELRQSERAEREFSALYKQLKRSQEEKDFLFKPKYVECFKWRRDLDRGLRIKEKSVENLREEFERIRKNQIEKDRKLKEELNIKRGVYKSLWRGDSVVNVAQTFNEAARSKSEPRTSVRQRIIDNEHLLTYGIGSRIWSSLSLEQVNILKNQLKEIYGNDERFLKRKTSKVPKVEDSVTKELRVGRNSDTEYIKLRNNCSYDYNSFTGSNKYQKEILKSSELTESEKRKLSQSISKEVMELQQKGKKSNVLHAKETRGAIAATKAQLSESISPRTCYSLGISEDEQKNHDFLLVFTKNDSRQLDKRTSNDINIWKTPTPIEPEVKTNCFTMTQEKSETESASTDGSTKTVIFNDNLKSKEKILAKVKYFEDKNKEVYTPIIYKPSDEPIEELGDTLVTKNESSFRRSQSNQDLRELFGESQLNRIVTEPLSASRKMKYTRPLSPILRSTFPRCRSLSPETRHTPNVNYLKDKFETLSITYLPRRCKSDPQLNKAFHDSKKVMDLRNKFEYPKISGRGRSRVKKSGLISSSHLKAEDRYMPHINIISKIAALYPKTHRTETSRSTENLANILGIPVGEVHKLRERFDAADKRMSILGHMFTSSPNINELRDVAKYLSGDWCSHKHPRAEEGDMVPKFKVQRPKSTSPPRIKNKLASILKLPERECVPFRSWWNPIPSKHNVHFKEPEGPPPPARSSDQEISEQNNTQILNTGIDKASPRKYVENEVTIHYRTPVRQEMKEFIDEQELAKRQADAMRKIYEVERQRKHLQVSHSDNELQDRKSRRHTDNFIQSQKSPIALNRYDDFTEDLTAGLRTRPRSPEPRLVAKALFNFVGQSARELTFKKGDIIIIRRQIDKNWYEGELNAMVGLFPSNYVEIVPYDGMKKPTRKPNEGQARAKYNFIAQTHLELSLAKGELVVVTRKVDDNWYEGRIGGRKGIFPVSYVEIMVDPQEGQCPPTKPVASPAAHSLLLNGSAGGKESMGTHSYVPTFPTQDLGMSYRARPVQITSGATYGSLKKNPVEEALHIDIQNEPIPYRAIYKYRPQNDDELELLDGDIVQVLEKCDDGWFVGTSERTGAFGTFPGNYVDQILN